MDRLFLDANILFSAANSPNAGLLCLWQLKNVVLCSSRYAVEEARFNLAVESQRRRLARLAQDVQLFDPLSRDLPAGVSLPNRDEPILLAAMEARATHLITGGVHHFGQCFGKRIEGILILTPADYLKTLRQ
jgi:uncharacterized protein